MDERLFDTLRVRISEPFELQAKKLNIFLKLVFSKSAFQSRAFEELLNLLKYPSIRLQLLAC